ncbi:MAG: helix-turn-helix transcriptional regulator [Burkholderiaceae bacterium]|nr:helix-turn-helix transcriptional regulator [Burkholderiaceae bacterium]
MAELSFRRGHRVELQEVAEATGIHRTTLYRMVNLRGYNASLSNIDALCRFFACGVGDVAVYVADEDVPPAVAPSPVGKAQG